MIVAGSGGGVGGNIGVQTRTKENGPRDQCGPESIQHPPTVHRGDKLGVLADPGDRCCQSYVSFSGLALKRSATAAAS